jgi:hypothetical protein
MAPPVGYVAALAKPYPTANEFSIPVYVPMDIFD